MKNLTYKNIVRCVQAYRSQASFILPSNSWLFGTLHPEVSLIFIDHRGLINS